MGYLDWKTAHNFFKLICIFVTLALVIWCSYEFNKNEDICEVIFKKFLDDDDSAYPILTFIIPDRFNETTLKKYDENINPEAYRNFILGQFWNDKALEIDYNDVTMDINDYLIEECFYTSIQAKYFGECKNTTRIEIQNFYGTKSITLHIPKNEPMYSVTVKLKKSVFESSVRPANSQFMILFSYPNR